MGHFERIWRESLFGKAFLVLLGFLLLAIVVGIPVGIIMLLSGSGRQQADITPTAPATVLVQATSTNESISASAQFTLTAIAVSALAVTPTLEATPPVQLTITNTNDFVNIRSGPGLTFTVTSRLNTGQTATVLGRSVDSGWWLIDINGTRGWVFGLLVILSGDRSSVPISQTINPAK
jgi:uncharacterized protein YraI